MKNFKETFAYWMVREVGICFKELMKEYYMDGKKYFKSVKKEINKIRKK